MCQRAVVTSDCAFVSEMTQLTVLTVSYTVSYRLTGGEPYALKGARTVRWGVHRPGRDCKTRSSRRLESHEPLTLSIAGGFLPNLNSNILAEYLANGLAQRKGNPLNTLRSALKRAKIPRVLNTDLIKEG